ncbi:MAG TPA: AMP-binding protein, partial [Steroidobacteraceae bacterium]|nr:AMP-binding protein [Steroidobacteraceae bacterium]
DPAAIPGWVENLWPLDVAEVSREAGARAAFYAQSDRRAALATQYSTLRALLEGSQLSWQVREASEEDDERVAELTRRTNQFNLSKRPLSTPEVADWRLQGREVWVMGASDRFGDYGTVGAALAHRSGSTLRVEQFVLSCRAMNRGLEYVMVRAIASAARGRGALRIRFPFRASPKNRPARLFVESLAEACRAELLPEGGCELALESIDGPIDALQATVLDRPFAESSDEAEKTPSAVSAEAGQRSSGGQGELLRTLAAQLRDTASIRRLIRRHAQKRDINVDFMPPRDDVQRVIAEVVAQHLNIEQLGVQDDLLALGMDSLRALQIVSAVRKYGYNLRIDDVFEHRTVEALAALCARTGSREGAAAVTPDAGAVAEAAGVAGAAGAAVGFDLAALPISLTEGIEAAYPLSSTQAGMVFHAERDTESPLYQVIDSFKLRGPFEEAAFRRVLSFVTRKHPALRTSFELARFELPMQLVHRHVEIPLEVIDLRGEPAAARNERFDSWLAAETTRRFDITRPPLLRYTVHLFEDGVFQVTLTQHHAILDGWSLNSLVRELLTTYADVFSGRQLPQPSTPRPAFCDFIQHEREALASAEQREFWRRKLADLQASAIPRWPEHTAAHKIAAEATHVVIPLSVSSALFDTARQAGVPIKSVLLAAHLRVVMYLSGRTDVVTGLLVNGRLEGGDGDRALGLFVNSVPLRARFGGGSWLDLARRCFELEREIQPYRNFPLSEMRKLSPVNPLFEFLFTFTHFHVLQGTRELRQFEVLDTFNFVRDNFPLQAFFDVDPFNGRNIRLMLGYDAARIPPVELDRIAALYLELLEEIGSRPGVSCFPPTLPASLSGHLQGKGQPAAFARAGRASAAPDFESIHRQIARHARERPDKIAVASGDWQLSYAGLHRQAATLAAALRRRNVGIECVVAVALEPSPLAVIAMLGILQAGAAYLPVDPAYPDHRIRAMLEDSGVALLIVDRSGSGLKAGLPDLDIRPALLEDLLVEAAAVDGIAPAVEMPQDAADSVAYVIYTSGSTGRPKGVMISHASIAHLFRVADARFGLDQNDVWSLFHSLSFDFSVWEMWAPLVSGGTLVPIPPLQRLDPQELQQFLIDNQVTVLNLTPSAITRLLMNPGPLRALAGKWCVQRLIAGGEALPPQLGQELLESGAALWNFYGPTEATVWASAFEVREPRDLEHLGPPLDNCSVDVLSSA